MLRSARAAGARIDVRATRCRYERPAGLVITVYVYLVYVIALRFEGCVPSIACVPSCPCPAQLTSVVRRPFTDMIYSSRAATSASTAASKKEL